MRALGRGLITRRHHGLRNTLAHFSSQANAIVEIEPQHCFPLTEKRPDLRIVLGTNIYLIDVSVVHSLNPSNLIYSQENLFLVTLTHAWTTSKSKALHHSSYQNYRFLIKRTTKRLSPSSSSFCIPNHHNRTTTTCSTNFSKIPTQQQQLPHPALPPFPRRIKWIEWTQQKKHAKTSGNPPKTPTTTAKIILTINFPD